MSAQIEIVANSLIASDYGARGGIILTDTTAVTGEFMGMRVLSDAVFTTLTTNFTKNGTVTAMVAADWGTLPEGFTLGAKITSVKLTSGKVQLLY